VRQDKAFFNSDKHPFKNKIVCLVIEHSHMRWNKGRGNEKQKSKKKTEGKERDRGKV